MQEYRKYSCCQSYPFLFFLQVYPQFFSWQFAGDFENIFKNDYFQCSLLMISKRSLLLVFTGSIHDGPFHCLLLAETINSAHMRCFLSSAFPDNGNVRFYMCISVPFNDFISCSIYSLMLNISTHCSWLLVIFPGEAQFVVFLLFIFVLKICLFATDMHTVLCFRTFQENIVIKEFCFKKQWQFPFFRFCCLCLYDASLAVPNFIYAF